MDNFDNNQIPVSSVVPPKHVFHDSLPEEYKRIAEHIHIFISHAKLTKLSKSEWVDAFRHDITPEAEIIFWQTVALSIVSYFLIVRESKGDALDTYSATEDLLTLEQVRTQVLSIPKDQFSKVGAVVLMKSKHLPLPPYLDREYDRAGKQHICEAMGMAYSVTEEKRQFVQRMRSSRHQQMFGQTCGLCQTINPSKACGRCRDIAYCSKDCQRQHWALHKRHCKDTRKQKAVQ